MHSCDVLIVGAGPAGTSCAWKLRRAGADVAILDKDVFPRDKICGGWITPRVLSILEIDAADYSATRILQPILAFRTGTIGGSDLETRYPAPVSYGIRRREFDHYLLERCGAPVFESAPLETLERQGDGWIANGSICARFIVGSGGHFCPVARLVGAKSRGEQAVVAQETEFMMDPSQIAQCRVRADTPELYFCGDLKGYGWCFRKGDVLNIGLGRADPHRLSEHVHDFVRSLRPRIGFEIPPLRGHAYLLYGSSPRRVTGDGWLLIGDAAGLAYPFSGEGILPAIESGLIAADAIASGNPGAYPALLADCLATPPGWVERAGAKIPERVIRALAPHLLTSKWFARDVVLDRWFLHSKN
jgi:menaquinone-9 beta-reductase